MLEAAEDLAEMVRVREATGIGDLFHRHAGVQQQPRGLVDPHLGRESRRGRSGACSEEMAEVGTAHPVLGGELIDAHTLGQARDDPRPRLVQQPLAFTGLVAQLVRPPFVGEHELEQRQLGLVSVTEVLLDRAPHETQGTGRQRSVRRRFDERTCCLHLPGNPGEKIGVVEERDIVNALMAEVERL